jgi:hypothetical protein
VLKSSCEKIAISAPSLCYQSARGLARFKTQSGIGFSPNRRLYEAGGQPMITENIDKMSMPLEQK